MTHGSLDMLVPVLIAIFIWWFGTGLVFLLVRPPRQRHGARFIVLSTIAAIALILLWQLREIEAVWAAYAGFVAALVIWAWHEASFLMGYLTGWRSTAPGCRKDHAHGSLGHFRAAAMAVIYHEIAIALTGLALIWMLWSAANQVGLWAFVILWLMRLSAKLNIYLGVPNLSDELFPEQLRFLTPYFAKRPINLLFPVSITAPTIIAGMMFGHIWFGAPGAFELVSACLLAMLLTLAIIEHWFLILPVADSILWRWAIGAGPNAGQSLTARPDPATVPALGDPSRHHVAHVDALAVPTMRGS